MDALLAEVKRQQSAVQQHKLQGSIKKKGSGVSAGGHKFGQLKTEALEALRPATINTLARGDKGAIGVDEENHALEWLMKAEKAMIQKTAIYRQAIVEAEAAQAEETHGTLDRDQHQEEELEGPEEETEESEENRLDDYGAYMSQMKRYKKESRKSHLLIDFAKKIKSQQEQRLHASHIDRIEATSQVPHEVESQESSESLLEAGMGSKTATTDSSASTSNQHLETLVDYMDEFGRVRQVSALDYERLILEDKKAAQVTDFSVNSSVGGNGCGGSSAYRDIYTSYEPITPIGQHYDADWEVRTLGVGFYKFSKNEAERLAAMQSIKNMANELQKERRLKENSREETIKNAIKDKH
jgi:Domain of unknown function (DUF4078)